MNIQTDNGDFPAKVLLRNWTLDQMGGAANCTVLEAFGGLGHLHDACYQGVKKHLAFELRKVERPTWLQGDNRVLLPKHVQGWDIYDLDSYTNPWILALNVCRLRSKGRFAIVVTDGTYRSFQTTPNKNSTHGGMGGYLRKASGYNWLPACPMLGRFYEEIVPHIVNDWFKHGINILAAKRIRSRGLKTKYPGSSLQVRYYSFIVEKS